MGSICLITLQVVSNYGSCLQTYATQEVFRRLGWDCEAVDYCRANNTLESLTENAFNGRRLKPFRKVWEKAPLLKHAVSIPISWQLRKNSAPFGRFREKYLRITERPYTSIEELEQDPPSADVYCTGSDQVWNSVWNDGFERPYYLTWAPEGKPRIAYAASIGREELDDWEKPLMREALERYAAISMRESSGVKLLSDLGIPSELVLDPTLMLDKNGWSKIATIPKTARGEYLLVYQLNRSEDFVRYAQGVSRALGLPIVKLCYRKRDAQRGAKNIVAPEVADFLGLFLNASCVITDSFHATAFSLNFQKPFVVIAPNRFSTRITSILGLTGTSDRMLGDVNDVGLMARPIDWGYVERALEAKRGDSLDYLRRALGANGEQGFGAENDNGKWYGC